MPAEDMEEVIDVLQIITGPLHNALLNRMDSTILSEGEVFTTALMAAAGKFVDMTNFEQLLAALKRLSWPAPKLAETRWPRHGKGESTAIIKSGIIHGKIRSIICAASLDRTGR